MIKYDVYKRPNGLFYRVAIHDMFHTRAELFAPHSNVWVKSALKVGDLVSSPKSSLLARNVVFKDSVCSQ
jgi:hypothetical protein